MLAILISPSSVTHRPLEFGWLAHVVILSFTSDTLYKALQQEKNACFFKYTKREIEDK